MRVVVTTWLALAITGCATVPKPDAYCDALRDFAIASDSREPRIVSLTSGRVFEVNEDHDDPDLVEIVMARKDCTQDGVKTSQGLCAYLLEYGFTEFPELMFQRAAQCVDLPRQSPLASGEYAPITSRRVAGRTLRSQLEISFSYPTGGGRPTLTVTARRVP
jgi:hypothetical protein